MFPNHSYYCKKFRQPDVQVNSLKGLAKIEPSSSGVLVQFDQWDTRRQLRCHKVDCTLANYVIILDPTRCL
ncbi:hypothetical protein F2P81_019943 [Scophthalmus maximus]|uniref:Uncharacterized protein n=1 Tax=Scophthalmus maximus TaxID=52904 RepID=A0A6A4S7M2_SCOMX|nr:hypothetical protein F2P81_019943 [Scophthalmus maximus]